MEKLKELIGAEVYDNHVAPKLPEGKKYFFAEGENFVPQSRIDEVTTTVKDYKAQLAERDKQISQLKDAAKGNEALTAKLNELQELNKKQSEEFQTKLLENEKNFALHSYLQGLNSKDSDLVKAKLDLTKAVYKDGQYSGLDEQVKSLKETHPYLFNEQPKISKIGSQVKPDTPATDPFSAVVDKYKN